MTVKWGSGMDTAYDSKKRIKFAIRLTGFLAVLAVLLGYAVYVLTPKYDYGVCSMLQYYALDPETVDVLAVGTSLTYTDLNTNILWMEYGIAAYDLASAEQPFWSTYYYLEEALSIHKPKVVLLDLKAITYLEDTVSRNRTVLSTFGLRSPLRRLKSIYECVEPGDFWSYALAFPQIHTNYEGLKAEDFRLPPTNGGRGSSWKGYIEKNATTAHITPVMDFTFNTALNVNPHEAEYFEKILQLCIREEVPVLLIGYPNADYMHDHLFYCTAFELAEPYGVDGINYNLPESRPPINYSTDCADWQHLNIRGSVIFSRTLAEDLLARYDLEDHRGDPAYASYDACAEQWFAKFPAYDRRTYKPAAGK